MAKFNEQNADHYECTGTDTIANCTAAQLANKQWGSSSITHNPPYNDGEYFSESYTMADWGTYPSVVTVAPEFMFYYQQYR